MEKLKGLFTCIALLSLPILAFATPKEGDIGQSGKQSTGYIQYLNTVLDAHTDHPVQSEVRQNFERDCGDTDGFDSLNWQRQDQQTTLIFTCFPNFDYLHGTTYAFVLNAEENSILTASSQNFQVNPNPTQKKTADGEPAEFEIVFTDTAVAVGAYYATTALAQKMYPGEADKKLHGKASLPLGAGFHSLAARTFKLSFTSRMLTSFAACVAVGALVEEIEPYFKYKGVRGDKDVRDIGADAIGCAVGVLIGEIVYQVKDHRFIRVQSLP